MERKKAARLYEKYARDYLERNEKPSQGEMILVRLQIECLFDDLVTEYGQVPPPNEQLMDRLHHRLTQYGLSMGKIEDATSKEIFYQIGVFESDNKPERVAAIRRGWLKIPKTRRTKPLTQS